MLGIKQTWMTLLLKVRRIPKKYIIPTAATIALIGGYVAVFVIERPVTLSYAAQTCVSSLTFFPSTHTTSENAAYAVSHTNTLKIGGVTLAAGDVCFTPLLAPTSGVVAKVHLSPFGGVVARQIFAVLAPPPVSVSARALSVPIPTSKPLHLQLSGPDIIFSYSLSANHKKVPCAKRDAAVVCDVPKLELAQGRDYAAVLHRQFADSSTATVLSRDIQTLSATTVTDSSVKANDVIYNKPQEFHFQFDKNLKSVDATVVRVEGDVRTEITSTAGVSGSSATIKLAEDLPRLKDIELRIDAVEAVDGSDLMEPYVTAVKTSGGPKVTGVNVSSTGIPMGALVAVTFDQALSGSQDISKLMTTTGGASFVRRQANQLVFSVAAVPKCGNFSITLTGDIRSQYDISGGSSWDFHGRTTCHSVQTFGYSTQGRPINVYYFGSGATTVLYTAAIHGGEMSTKYLMDQWIQELEAHAQTIPAHLTVAIVPVINPDGLARGERLNARGIDLNRNFGTSDWKKDITNTNDQPFAGGGGEAAMSELETQAIAALVQRLQPRVVLSYHSIGGVVAANQAGSSSTWAATYARHSGYRNVTGQTSGTFDYAVSGTADDYYAEVIGIPSVLVELGSHINSQLSRNLPAMWAMIRD